jgi:rubrerythrin
LDIWIFLYIFVEVKNKNIMKADKLNGGSQYQLQLEIQASGFNVVTCGSCGDVMFHKIQEGDLKCPSCGFEDEQCEFPDLFHQ